MVYLTGVSHLDCSLFHIKFRNFPALSLILIEFQKLIDLYVSQDLPKQNQIRQKNTMSRVKQERTTCLFTFTIFSPRARTVKMAQGYIHVGTISQTVLLKSISYNSVINV